jgi:serine/threonine protein kinase
MMLKTFFFSTLAFSAKSVSMALPIKGNLNLNRNIRSQLSAYNFHWPSRNNCHEFKSKLLKEFLEEGVMVQKLSESDRNHLTSENELGYSGATCKVFISEDTVYKQLNPNVRLGKIKVEVALQKLVHQELSKFRSAEKDNPVPDVFGLYYFTNDEDEEIYVIKMERIKGRCFSGKWKYISLMPNKRKMGALFVKQLIPALFDIQDLCLVHHDVKPDNIMFNPEENKFYIIDFGAISAFTDTTNLRTKGTYRFMSPQKAWYHTRERKLSLNKKLQVNEKIAFEVARMEDVYSFGIALSCMCRGVSPEGFQYGKWENEDPADESENQRKVFIPDTKKNYELFEHVFRNETTDWCGEKVMYINKKMLAPGLGERKSGFEELRQKLYFPLIGYALDINGCQTAMGYEWCKRTKRCIQPWKEVCPREF